MDDGIGAEREEIWRRFADELGARYVPGDFWEKEQIVATVPPWTVTFDIQQDTLSSTEFAACTRLIARYVATEGFSFSVRRRDVVGGTGLAAALPRIAVGDRDFDSRFDVIGSDPARTLEFLSNEAIHALLMAEPHISLDAYEVKGSASLAELACAVPVVVGTRRRLLGLFELMAGALQHLRAMGAAANTNPSNVA
jgi:hypothetical protein